MRRPNDKTILKVVQWLDDNGFSIYGQTQDLETAEEYEGLRDYSGEDILKLVKARKRYIDE